MFYSVSKAVERHVEMLCVIFCVMLCDGVTSDGLCVVCVMV